MGEDSCKIQSAVEKKATNFSEMSNQRNGDHSFPTSSTISTCSDVDSEGTSYIGDDNDQDYQYGPGIVSKLRTKFLTISLKQNRGAAMRRSCSMENLLDKKPSDRNSNVFAPQNRLQVSNCNGSKGVMPSWNNLKRAKSMDTLLASLESSTSEIQNTTDEDKFKKFKEPKVICRRDGPLNRATTVTITDEEFPKPDTVKTYKRMFEPADSKKTNSNSNVRRRPPVLRASAKSGSNSNTKSAPLPNSQSKVNGVQTSRATPTKFSAKDAHLRITDGKLKTINVEKCKVISPVEDKTVEKELIVKKQEAQKNAKNHLSIKNDIICNGTAKSETTQLKVKEEITKRNSRVSKQSETNCKKPTIPVKKPHLFKKPSTGQVTGPKTSGNSRVTKDIPPVKLTQNVNTGKTCIRTPEKVQDNVLTCKNEETPIPKLEPVTNGFDKVQSENVQKVPEVPLVETKDCSKRTTSAPINSMVFDFRGKDVVTHLSVSPAPFGCKAVIRKRNVLIDGKESVPHLNGLSNGGDSEDEDFVDYSVPPPCGLVFVGENVRVGKGSILATRNKDLKIKFEEEVESNIFVYPSEGSFCVEDSSLSSSELSSLDSESPEPVKMVNGGDSIKLPSNTSINSGGSGGLMSYTPSVLRTVDNFQLGLFRVAEETKKKKPEEEKEGEEENQEQKDVVEQITEDMLKPADPESTSSWSLSAGTSDLLF